MDGKVQMAFTISQKAQTLVTLGKATISSGGVRANDGSLIELAQPAIMEMTKNSLGSVVKNVASPVALASSLTNNVQSAFIQKGVNQANRKLDVSLEKLDQIQESLNGMKSTYALSWANCALGMANFGITLAGFAMVFKKLDNISAQLSGFEQRYTENENGKLIEEWRKYRQFIVTDLQFLDKGDYLYNVARDISEMEAYLKKIIDSFENRSIDGEIGCNLIFGLVMGYARLVQEYTARFYYKYREKPQNYLEWIDVLNKLSTPEFQDKLKHSLIIDYVDLPYVEKMKIYNAAMYSVAEGQGRLVHNETLIQQIAEQDYLNLDQKLCERISNQEYDLVGKRVVFGMG